MSQIRLGELGVCDSNLYWSSAFQETPPCMLSFLVFPFGWPLECHPKTPRNRNDVGTQTGACFLNVRIKALDALAPTWTRGPVRPAMGSPIASSSGRGGLAVGTGPGHSLAQPHGECIDFPLSLSSFFKNNSPKGVGPQVLGRFPVTGFPQAV